MLSEDLIKRFNCTTYYQLSVFFNSNDEYYADLYVVHEADKIITIDKISFPFVKDKTFFRLNADNNRFIIKPCYTYTLDFLTTDNNVFKTKNYKIVCDIWDFKECYYSIRFNKHDLGFNVDKNFNVIDGNKNVNLNDFVKKNLNKFLDLAKETKTDTFYKGYYSYNIYEIYKNDVLIEPNKFNYLKAKYLAKDIMNELIMSGFYVRTHDLSILNNEITRYLSKIKLPFKMDFPVEPRFITVDRDGYSVTYDDLTWLN